MTELYDLVIDCDDAIDPGSDYRGPAEIAVKDGRIAAFAPELPPHRAARRVDARGRLVCPGPIDFHVHVYEWVTNFGLHPDEAGVHSGATTIVDQGSSGAWTVGGFDAYIARPAETDVRAFVSANLAGALKGGMEGTVLHNPGMMRIEAIAEVAAAYPHLVKGIKSHGESGGLSHWGLDVLKMAVEAGEAAGLPLYVHTGELFPVDEANRPEPARRAGTGGAGAEPRAPRSPMSTAPCRTESWARAAKCPGSSTRRWTAASISTSATGSISRSTSRAA